MTAARHLFGTDGIRGVANVEPLTPETVLALGRALARAFGSANPSSGQRPRVVIGRDTRLSGGMLEAALTAGLSAAGIDVCLAGVLPTPAIALLTRTLPADAGVVVSASHNLFADNGLKVFDATGFKLPDAVEQTIEQRLHNPEAVAAVTGAAVGGVAAVDRAAERYVEHLCRVMPAGVRLDGLRVVIDCAHGAAHRVGPEVFRALGADVTALGVAPDGRNINAGCGATHPQPLQEAVRAAQAHLGVALDGDADRLILVDESGTVVDGDEALAIFAVDMTARGALKGDTVVATVMSNLGLEVALRERGVRLARTAVGDRYVVEAMRRGGFNLGGEQSGHLVLLDHSTTGDGLLAALALAALLVTRQRPLSDMKRVMTKLPQVLRNVRVARRADLEGIPAVRRCLDAVRGALHDRGRVLVRYSGTEPLVRVMVEGEDAAGVARYAEEIAAAIELAVGTGV